MNNLSFNSLDKLIQAFHGQEDGKYDGHFIH